MDQAAEVHIQAPPATHTNDEVASMACSEDEGIARLLDLAAEPKSDIGDRLTKLEARSFEDAQASVVSAGSSTFHANVEMRACHGREKLNSRLNNEVMPGSARQNSAGKVHQRMKRADDRQGTRIRPPRDTGHRPVPAQTYFAVQRHV
uniref:AlNc14C386G11260 protein n=1 Tax=Albugo laibachii Nc14 TaxID=890382 RepID=F0WYJ7_9STRA|nr:AlNc14C386G11260 [Albugo laibachii Nc14]|eukprot:CCA26555.1 AlNc14C386G11260 [Albugo laibachii Nc14]